MRPSIERLADDAPVARPDSWLARRPPSVAYEKACAVLEAGAFITVRDLTKLRARAYARKPHELDAIADGLFACSPRDLVLALNAINAVATMRGQRWVGFGGEVPAINLKGAMLYARYSRAKTHQLAVKAREGAP